MTRCVLGTAVVRLAVALLALHALAVVWSFPARHATLDDPFASADTSYYLASGLDAADGGRLHGYSPSHMAGYPYGSWMSLGRKGYEAAMLWSPGGDPLRRYYLFILFTALTTPLWIGLAALSVGLSRRAALITAAAAALVSQIGDPLCSFWDYGTTAFPFSCALAVLAAGLCWQPTRPRAVLAGLVAALAIWVHTIAVVPLALGLLAVVLSGWRDAARRQRLVAIAVALLVAGALVIPGHRHYLQQLDLRVPMRPQFLAGGLRFMVLDLLDDRAYGRPYDRRVVLHAMLILASWQALAEPRGARRGLAALWVGGLLCLAVAWLAGGLPVVRELQPYRFVASAQLFLIVPALYGLGRLTEAVRLANPAGRAAVAALGLCLLPAFTGSLLELHQRQPMSGLTTDEEAVLDWVVAHDGPGRIGCEPAALGNLLPHLTGRETIGGGISNHAVVREAWASIDADWAFGQPLEHLTPAAFEQACALLDIRALIVETEPLAALVEQTPATLAVTVGPLRIYTREPAPAAGIWPGCYTGQVTAVVNGITIDNPPAGAFVINYHFDRELQPSDGVMIEPAELDGAGAAFIRVDNRAGLGEIELVAGP